ncbi:hypothetical protein TB1_003726 [Malus domestica]
MEESQAAAQPQQQLVVGLEMSGVILVLLCKLEALLFKFETFSFSESMHPRFLMLLSVLAEMYTSRKKISNDNNAQPTEFEESVAQALFDLENTNQELKSDTKDLYSNSSQLTTFWWSKTLAQVAVGGDQGDSIIPSY